MGICHGKPTENPQRKSENPIIPSENEPGLNPQARKSSNFPFYSPSPLHSVFKNSPANSSVSSTPLRKFKLPFPPPSPAKHIRALLARRHGSVKPNEASIPEGNEIELGLDKNFGFSKQFMIYYELGERGRARAFWLYLLCQSEEMERKRTGCGSQAYPEIEGYAKEVNYWIEYFLEVENTRKKMQRLSWYRF